MGRYADSPAWADVVPFPQDDGGPNPLAAIAYTDGYAEAMGYLRAVMAANETSERALELTEDIIGMNPAHYTVWLYRASILAALGSDPRAELAWLNAVALAHPKNYQIWHHRQQQVERAGDAAGEVAFVNRMLAGDAKNYHVWSHRQWLVRRFGLWGGARGNGRRALEGSGGGRAVKEDTTELEETELFLADDVRNNSAWNHRFFLVNGDGRGVETDGEVYDRERRFAEDKVRLAPQNQSPWNYLRGTVERAKGKGGIVQMEAFCREFVAVGGDGERVRSSHAMQILAEVCALKGRRDEARGLYALLADKYDPVRVNYWKYMSARMDAAAA